MEGAGYALGHAQRELDRLSVQARVFEPFTRRMLRDAGISPGMRVLDVGSGAGDVAFLCAEVVGPAGKVTGVDRAPAAVETATGRAHNAGWANVEFLTGDPTQMAFAEPFDAVIGRLVLMHQPQPAAMLRSLAGLLRPGGVVAFQEFDIAVSRTVPRSPTFERCLEWIHAAFARVGTDSAMGPQLYGAFVSAGLPGPRMSFDAGIWGGEPNPAPFLVSEVVRTLLPVLERFGIASAADIRIDTLCDRIQQELLEGGGVAISPALVGAWTRANGRADRSS